MTLSDEEIVAVLSPSGLGSPFIYPAGVGLVNSIAQRMVAAQKQQTAWDDEMMQGGAE